MLEELTKCEICPYRCKVNRLQGQKGKCNIADSVKIALASLHYFEEPCISGENGSGTIFFSGCNLHCKFCQNYEISQQGKGKEITIEHLAQLFSNQQNKGAHNINLVTPTMYLYQIKEAINIARKNGLSIPIVYNSNGYENVESIQQLEGYIDIYLPDLKYSDNVLAQQYSGAKDYFDVATKAILEMYRQVGKPVLDKDGIMQKGLMIRHLILPNHMQNSKKVLDWIKVNLGDSVYVSLMAQYFPTYLAKEDKDINRKLTKKEYEEIEEYLYHLELENGYIQELGEHEEEYVPTFDLSE